MHSYVTLFDFNYRALGLSMIDSLLRHSNDSVIYVLALDSDVGIAVKEIFPNVIIINLGDVEYFYPEILHAKKNRSKVEYYYTLSSVSVNYVLEKFIKKDMFLTYLDSDLFFFGSPEVILQELSKKEASVGIIPHRFSFVNMRNKRYGKYNVGWVSFRNDINGLSCAKHWMHQCVEWCYQRVEINRYADQKYLDFWPSKFERVVEIENLGANVAVWNLRQFSVRLKGADILFIKSHPLIFYHFAGLKNLSPGVYDTNLSSGFIFCINYIRSHIYLPYINSLIRFQSSGLSKPKPDIHYSGFVFRVRKYYISLRKFIFKDVIDVN